jgi:DNA polymerase I-like protein with 3'-5' exonuclease and polymerase domains
MAYYLVSSADQVEEYLARDHPRNLIGMDTEATSLNTKRAKLVGISLALGTDDAIYIPTGHTSGPNLSVEAVWPIIQRKLETHKPIFYNAKYDLNILHRWTGQAIQNFGDALELVYLSDPDRKRKSLKEIARTELNFEMEKFDELFTDEERRSNSLNIANKTPARCTNYACADADAGLRVWEMLRHVEEEFKTAITIDHQLIDIVRRIEHNGGMELNLPYIQDQIGRLAARADAIREQIFRTVGSRFELGSPKQLGIALFERMGIPSPGMTNGRNPIYITREEVLEKLSASYPVVDLVIAYRKVEKARSSYFAKLEGLARRGRKPRFSFNMFSAPTFRFAAPGGDPDVDGFTGINIQAVSNGEARNLMGVLLVPTKEEDDYLARIDEDDLLVELPETATDVPTEWSGDVRSLPYVIETEAGNHVCIRETCAACPTNCAAKGIDVTRRLQTNVLMVPSVRQAFRAPEGWTLVSFDYKSQELVIGANMSGEPRWINALLRGEDLHISTATSSVNMTLEQFLRLPKGEQEQRRGIGKMSNFLCFYGGNAYTLQLKAGLTRAQAEQFYNGFVKNHPTLFSWIQKVQIFSKKVGYTTTYFGRKRSLKHLYADPSPRGQAFANRSAVNTAIQGTGAEVTRIAMVKVAKALSRAELGVNQVRFVMQLHDELTFLIRDELLDTAIPLIKSAMEFKVKSWQVQLSVDFKLGTIWGLQRKPSSAAQA